MNRERRHGMSRCIRAAFFSPTGSSRALGLAAAATLACELTEPCGESWDWTFPEGREAAHACGAEDVFVFAFPVYAGRIPQLLLPVLSRLEGRGARAVVLAVYGNRHYDDALLEAVDELSAHGFSVVAAAAFVARHSLTPKVGAGRPDLADMTQLKEFARKTARLIAAGTTATPATVAVPGNRPYRVLPPSADIRPKTLESCTRCGLCASLCPVRVINPEDPGEVSQGCLRCCACVNACPERAKYFDDPRVDKVVAMLESACLARREPEVFFAPAAGA